MTYYKLCDNTGETRLVFRYGDKSEDYRLDRWVPGTGWVREPDGHLLKHIFDPDGNEEVITQAEAESFTGV